MGNRVGAALIVVAAALSASAQAVRGEDKAAAARSLYQQGTAAYNIGDFTEAIEKFKAAYKLRPEPAFIYNIAQSHRHLKEYSQALFSYRAYLRSAPNAPNHAEAEARIKELEAILAQPAQPAQAKPTAPPPVTSGAETTSRDDTTARKSEKASESTGSETRTVGGKTEGRKETKKETKLAAAEDRKADGGDGAASARKTSAATTSLALARTPESASAPPTLVKAPEREPAPEAEPSSPFYKTWWFWTAAGVLIAGGVVTAIVLSTRSNGGGGTQVFCMNDPNCGRN